MNVLVMNLWTVALQAPLFTEFSRQEYTGVGSHFLLQGIFLTQGLTPGILHCRQIIYHLSRQRGVCKVVCVEKTWPRLFIAFILCFP